MEELTKITGGKTSEFLKNINGNFEKIEKAIKNISYGTEIPDNSNGSNGDIYIQYEN